MLPASCAGWHVPREPGPGLSEPPTEGSGPAFRLEAGPLRALFYAPQQLATPSAGFASVLLFHLINLRRQLAGRPPHSIVLCGFSGQYIGGGYPGHDFHFEQQELRKLPNVSFLNAGTERKAPPPGLHHDLATIFHPAYGRLQGEDAVRRRPAASRRRRQGILRELRETHDHAQSRQHARAMGDAGARDDAERKRERARPSGRRDRRAAGAVEHRLPRRRPRRGGLAGRASTSPGRLFDPPG